MSKLIKTTTLLVAAASLLPVLAGYRFSVPLEKDKGGSLPNGSIIINEKNNNNTENDTDITGKTCTYNPDAGSMITLFKTAFGPFQAGDKEYTYKGNIVGFYSPSNGYSGPPNGVARGIYKESQSILDYYQICIDTSKTYPTLSYPGDWEFPGELPEEPKPKEECVFNLDSDYYAYDTVSGQSIMNSVQFGISITTDNWMYVPDDNDPEIDGSYIYYDNGKLDFVNGPNPNYQYTYICRKKK